MSPTFFKRKVGCSVFPKFGELPMELQLQIWYFACLNTPYNPDNEGGKLWQGFQVSGHRHVPQKRQVVHILRPIASLPTWRRVKHFKRRHTADETDIIVTDRRKTHALLRTCLLSRWALMERFNLRPAWNTIVNFDSDVFFFDLRCTGFPLSKPIFDRPISETLMLRYPEYAAKIKNLAISDELLGTQANIAWLTGTRPEPFIYDAEIKRQFTSLEQFIVVSEVIHCEKVPSTWSTPCHDWEIGRLRYTEEDSPNVHPWLTGYHRACLAERVDHWKRLPTCVAVTKDKIPAVTFKLCMEVVCLHSDIEKRARDVRKLFVPNLEAAKVFSAGPVPFGYRRAILETLEECRNLWRNGSHY